MIFVVEDNGYAISTPVEVGTAGGDISKLVSGFPNLYMQKCDGTDPLESLRSVYEAVEYCRERKGPAFIHAKVIRPYSHSLSDDEKLYRPAEELEADAAIDPIKTYAEFLMTEGIASSEDLEALRKEVDDEVNKAADIAIETPQPAPETAYRNVFSPDVDPTDRPMFDTEEGAELSGNAGTMVDLINRCMHEEMERDPRIVVFGEDVADCSREEYLEQVKGKGGVFKVTANLQRKFGSARVFNSPLAEANIVGRAVGMAIRGLEAGRRDPVFRLHFPGVSPDPQRGRRDALALGRRHEMPDGHARAGRRLSKGRCGLSLAIGHDAVFAHAGPDDRLSVDRARRQRSAAHVDPLRRSGACSSNTSISTARSTTNRNIRRAISDPVRQGKERPRRHRRNDRHLRRAGRAL